MSGQQGALDFTRGNPTGEQVKGEYTRRKTNREALADLLADGQWHTNSEMHEVAGFRYGARLLELRQAGHVIHAQDIARGRWRWRLDPTRTVDADCIYSCCIGREPGTRAARIHASPECLIHGCTCDGGAR